MKNLFLNNKFRDKKELIELMWLLDANISYLLILSTNFSSLSWKEFFKKLQIETIKEWPDKESLIDNINQFKILRKDYLKEETNQIAKKIIFIETGKLESLLLLLCYELFDE